MNNTIQNNNFKSDKTTNNMLVAAVVFMSLFILNRDIFGMNISKFILIAVTAAFMCFLNKNEIVALMAFVAPLSVGVSYNYLSAIALILFVIKSKGRITANPIGLFSIVAIVIIEILSSFFWEFSFFDFFIFVGVFLFCFLKMLDAEEYDNRKIVLFFIIGFWVTIISLYGQVIAEYGFEGLSDFADNLDRFGNTNQLLGYKEGMRVSYNPNGLGSVCMQTTLLSLLLYRIDGKVYQIVSAILAVFVGIATQSRTYFIVTASALIIFFLFNRSKSKGIGKKVLISFSGIIAVYYAVTYWLKGYLEALGQRMQEDDIFNGRGEIATEYFDKFFESPLKMFFGVGLQDYQEKYGMEMSCHNATQEILVTWGILGLLCVIILFFVILGNMKFKDTALSNKIVFMLPFFATMVYMQTGQGFSDSASMLKMMVIVSAIGLINIRKGDGNKNEGHSFHPHIQ